MAMHQVKWGHSVLLVLAVMLLVLPGRVAAFGAGNIPSIAQVEGHNWRHGDIEDMIKTVAFLHGKKWTTMLVARTYFGNWLRDYSQAIDVGSLKGINAATIRILVWVLSFMAHGYATDEFEVTEERLGVYRPEEHIDNPIGYADGVDARTFDPRLRGPVDPREIEIDPRTGMKNYIANESGGWATSTGYLRFSFARSIHYGRVYTHGASGTSGKEADLCEALRCLGQALHCMEDFSAHSNYCELALRELGYHEVFPHCGAATEIRLGPHGKTVYPLVTGSFGGVDFLHSVIGEANDHFTQSEVDELNLALKNADGGSAPAGAGTSNQRGLFGLTSGGEGDFISLLSRLPGPGGDFAAQARDLQASSAAQARDNANQNVVPGMSPSLDPVKVAKQIYPILRFRDRIVKAINNTISKIPGLEKLIERISEKLTAFVLGLLAPFIRPIINQISKTLKEGSSGVIASSAKSQLEPWTNPRCDNPTHSMLSKDHFTNILNSCAGRVATTVLQYVVPRVLFAWDNPGVPVDEVVNDVLRAFHHPAIRDENVQIQRDMFETVRRWTAETPYRHQLNQMLGSESIRNGKNHILNGTGARDGGPGSGLVHDHGHGRPASALWSQIRTRDLNAMSEGGGDGLINSSAMPGAPLPPPQDYGYMNPAPPPYPQGGYGTYAAPGPQYGQLPMPPCDDHRGSWAQGLPPQGYGGGGGGGGAPGPSAYEQHIYGPNPPY